MEKNIKENKVAVKEDKMQIALAAIVHARQTWLISVIR